MFQMPIFVIYTGLRVNVSATGFEPVKIFLAKIHSTKSLQIYSVCTGVEPVFYRLTADRLNHLANRPKFVEGFEPSHTRSRVERSNQLSYTNKMPYYLFILVFI